jgi:hypothetical protein
MFLRPHDGEEELRHRGADFTVGGGSAMTATDEEVEENL